VRPAAAGLLATLAFAGCGLYTTTKSGEPGDTLTAGGLGISLIKFDNEVPRREGRDITGLGTPSPGMRFFGFDVKACNDRGQAIGTFNFGLDLDGDDKAKVRFPQSVYPNGFESTRQGCERGWIVFEGPKGSQARKLTFKYDDSGSGGPSGDTEKHAHFSWDLSG
jgi:hypothetical protein